ncbi:porin [Chromobacterium piscinae]|uniref:porin n=1 Tax=Chromobacterium piscinae TaxID=686831 RepID=UPI001E30ED71|nr:porin [Chromobacterium piscinae]MCD4505766.1 porin [Chromobacterium piscinae]
MLQHIQKKWIYHHALIFLSLIYQSPLASANSFLLDSLYKLPQFNGTLKDGGVAPYGTLDLGINYSHAGNNRNWKMQSGGEWTSKFGLYGREPLGNGWKTEFNLEAGFNTNSGSDQIPNPIFNREAWLGLESQHWGSLRLGRQLNTGLPLFVDPFGAVNTNSVYSWVGMGAVQTSRGILPNGDLGPGAAQLDSRVSNAVKWNSPRGAGLNIEVVHTAREDSEKIRPKSQGILLAHLSEPHLLAASFNQSWHRLSPKNPLEVRNDFYGLAAIYDIGILVLSTSYSLTVPRWQETGIARVYTAGAILTEKRHTYRLSTVYRNTSGARDSDGKTIPSSAIGIMLGYDYNVSRRTGLYTRIGAIRNRGGSSIVLNGQQLPVDHLGQPATRTNPLGISAGLYHHFF